MKEIFNSLGLLWLRLAAGLGMAWHGYGKIFGGWMPKFTQGVAEMGFPYPEVFAWAAALSEFAGGLLLAAGLFSKPAALFIFSTMGVAAFIRHAADPFHVKELALAFWTVAGALVLLGPGRFSIDALREKKKTP